MTVRMYSLIDEYSTGAFDGIPSRLDEMAPGPVLAAYLSAIETSKLSGHDRVVVMRARQRMASHYAAQLLDDMHSVATVFTEGSDGGEEWEHRMMDASAEIRAALRLTRRSADNQLQLAMELIDRHPDVLAALSAGTIDERRAKVIVHGTIHLDTKTAADVVRSVLDDAGDLTTGQLRARIRRLCIEVNPEDAADRFETAIESRKVTTQPTEDGTVHLYATDLPPDELSAAKRRINEIAKSLRSDDETRTMDQIRADVFLDLLNGTSDYGATNQGSLDIRVDLTTLTGLDENPAELAGYGPVIADIARQVAGAGKKSQWRYLVTDPETGQPLVSGITGKRPETQAVLDRRMPGAPQRRYLEQVHPRCVFPGCRMPATECDIDHRIDYANGGATADHNLTPLCRNDHMVKHRAGWTYRQLPDGSISWTSPLNHTYTSQPGVDGRSPP